MNRNNRKYCVVGGFGVLLHLLVSNSDDLRATGDMDLMVTEKYLNSDFVSDYFSAFASNSEQYAAIYNALFQGSSFEQFSDIDDEIVNTSFIGASEELDNINTPDIDLVRQLNNLTYDDLHIVTIMLDDTPIKVASIEDLMIMKERTIDYLSNDLHISPRPQDLNDRASLNSILEQAAQGVHMSEYRIIDDTDLELE